MQLQFDKMPISCLKSLKREPQSQEQTQEFRISDGMPDIGRIVGAWGQVILRSKEWRGDSIAVSGGTMVWVQYLPEGGGQTQCVETWLPFQMNWSIPPTQRDGVIHTECFLCGVDARSTSARKMMIRSNVSVLATVMEKQEVEVFSPGDMPKDIQLQKHTYPVSLLAEAGEKALHLEETLQLPPSAPKIEKLYGYSLIPEIVEEKRMVDKLVFRGNGVLHLQYLSDDGGQYTWDFELPFTQYAELEQEYSENAGTMVLPSVTALELDLEADQLKVKAGLVCQYQITDQTMVEVVTDAYSTLRAVEPVKQPLELSGILETKVQTLRPQINISLDMMRLTDVQFLPQCVHTRTTGDTVTLEIPGQFQVLYYDMEGQLHTTLQRWEDTVTMPAGENCCVQVTVTPIAKPQGNITPGNTQLSAELIITVQTISGEGIPMVTGLDADQIQKPDPRRPSLILLTPGQKDLWQLAKEYGSTVDAIRNANHLQDAPDPSKVLLIPVL